MTLLGHETAGKAAVRTTAARTLVLVHGAMPWAATPQRKEACTPGRMSRTTETEAFAQYLMRHDRLEASRIRARTVPTLIRTPRLVSMPRSRVARQAVSRTSSRDQITNMVRRIASEVATSTVFDEIVHRTRRKWRSNANDARAASIAIGCPAPERRRPALYHRRAA